MRVPYTPFPEKEQQFSPGPEIRLNVNANMFGAPQAKALEGLGQSVSKLGNSISGLFEKQQNVENDTSARDINIQNMTKLGQAETGFYSKQGKNAVDAYDDYVKQLTSLRTEALGQAPNDTVRKEVDRLFSNNIGNAIVNGGRHVATEQKKYTLDTMDASIGLNVQKSAGSDDETFDTIQNDTANAIARKGQVLGWSPESLELETGMARSTNWGSRLNYLAQTDGKAALEMYDAHKSEITPDYRQKLEQQLWNAVNTKDAAKLGKDALTPVPPSAPAPSSSLIIPEDYPKKQTSVKTNLFSSGSWTGPSFNPADDLSTIRTGSATTQVNKWAAPAFQGFLEDLSSRGYKVTQLEGYNDRNKVGGSSRSEHAYGNAIDINPYIPGKFNGGNEYQPISHGNRTDLPPDVSAIAAKHGLSWGGDWKEGHKDYMHFEWTGVNSAEAAPAATGRSVAAQGSIYTPVATDTRADKNFNPGNIAYGPWAIAHGATHAAGTDTGHGVAVFSSPQAGFSAMAALALAKYNGGKKSANDLIAGSGGWTPGNREAAANVAGHLGLTPDADLMLNDPERMKKFQIALATQEGAPKLVSVMQGGHVTSAMYGDMPRPQTTGRSASTSAPAEMTEADVVSRARQSAAEYIPAEKYGDERASAFEDAVVRRAVTNYNLDKGIKREEHSQAKQALYDGMLDPDNDTVEKLTQDPKRADAWGKLTPQERYGFVQHFQKQAEHEAAAEEKEAKATARVEKAEEQVKFIAASSAKREELSGMAIMNPRQFLATDLASQNLTKGDLNSMITKRQEITKGITSDISMSGVINKLESLNLFAGTDINLKESKGNEKLHAFVGALHQMLLEDKAATGKTPDLERQKELAGELIRTRQGFWGPYKELDIEKAKKIETRAEKTDILSFIATWKRNKPDQAVPPIEEILHRLDRVRNGGK